MIAKKVDKMSVSKKYAQESKRMTEKDSIVDKEDIDREGINIVYNMENFESNSESDKDDSEYEGTINLDEEEWSDEGAEIRDNLGDED